MAATLSATLLALLAHAPAASAQAIIQPLGASRPPSEALLQVQVTVAEAPIRIEGAWARATPPHAATGAIYLSLTAAQDDTLTGAATQAAAHAELHESTTDAQGVARMRPVKELPLPAGKTVTLDPGRYHLMLTGLAAPLVAGQSVSLHLTFAHAPPIDIQVPVLRIGAAGPNGSAPPGTPTHDMKGMKM